MKIPETSANVGAYYGNEENGQWQPNGVIIDGGVGGGIVGSGDAGVHRPGVYPVHIPRGHMPAGYVMAGAYYPPAAYAAVPAPVPDDFADYMWMENEEEFDKQVMQQLEEEALMEQCIEAMLEDEQRERNNRPHVANGHNHYPTTSSNGGPSISLEETVSKSTLNPLAAEFVPTRVIQAPPMENKQEPQSTQTIEEVTQKTKEEENVVTVAEEKNDKGTEVKTETIEEIKTEQLTPPKDPPEVSAADVHPIEEKQKDSKKDMRPRVEAKKNLNTSPKVVKVEPKKKPTVVKSEPKITPKKKEVNTVKSETRVEEKSEEVVSIIEASKSPQTEEPTQTPSTLTSTANSAQNLDSPTQELSPETTPDLGPKPVNYAAAARANKPKKPSAATVEKTVQPVQKKLPDKKKTEKPTVQRKNSAK